MHDSGKVLVVPSRTVVPIRFGKYDLTGLDPVIVAALLNGHSHASIFEDADSHHIDTDFGDDWVGHMLGKMGVPEMESGK